MDAELPDYASSDLIFKRCMIHIIHESSKEAYQEINKICAIGIQRLQQKEFKDYTALAGLYFQWIRSYAQKELAATFT